MGRDFKNIYCFLTDDNNLFYRAKKDILGNWIMQPKSNRPFPITYNPINFSGTPLEFATNTKYFSLTRSISYPLEFIQDAAVILNNIFLLGRGIEERCFLTIVEWDSRVGYFTLSYKGRIDFGVDNFNAKTGVFSVPTVDDSAWGVLSKNDSVKYEVDCSALNPNAIKVLIDGITLINNYTFQTVQSDIFTSDLGDYHVIPFVLVNQDGDSSGILAKNQTGQVFGGDINDFVASSPSFGFATQYLLNQLKINGTFSFVMNSDHQITGGLSVYFYTSKGRQFDIYQKPGGGTILGVRYDIPINMTIDLAADEKVFLICFMNDFGPNDFHITPFVQNIVFSAKTKSEPVITYALRPLDLLQEVVSRATRGRYTIKSDYFTENNKIVLTSGNAIRGLPNAAVYCSFEEIFKSYDVLKFMALRTIQGELYIEPVSEVYKQNSTIFDLGEVLECEFETALEYFCNEISVGSKPQDYRHPSGRLEVNTTNLFSLPFLNVQKKLELITSFRTGCYDIQFLILDYKNQSTQDNLGDNDTYMLDITDETGNANEDIETFENITVNNTPLAPIIKEPLTDDYIFYNKPVIRGIAKPGDNINIYADTVLDGSTVADADGNWSYDIVNALTSYVPGVTTGIHIIQATFTDLGAPSTSITITIDTSIVTPVLITYPRSDDAIYNNLPLIKGVAPRGTNVDIFIDAVFQATVVTDNSCKWQYKVPPTFPLLPTLGNGLHTVTANAASCTFRVTSNVAHPLITYIGSELDGFALINNLPLIRGVALPGTLVQLFLDYISYIPMGSCVADGNGNWEFQVVPVNYYVGGVLTLLTPIPNGVHVISTSLINYTVQIGVSGFKLNRPDYTSITGVTDNTVFNTELSPKRCLLARGSLLSAVMDQMKNEFIYFQKPDKNANQVTLLNGVTVSERSNVSYPELGQPLFKLKYAKIKTRVPHNFNELLYNFSAGGLIKFQFKGTEINVLPIGNMKMANITDDIQEWKLLLSPLTSNNDILNIHNRSQQITLNKNQMYHSDYNTLHFVKYDFVLPEGYADATIYEDWFNNRNSQWAINPKYIQKIAKTDIFKDQIITNGISGATLRMYDCFQAKIGHLDIGVVATFDYNPINPAPIPIPDIVLQTDIDLSTYPDSQYFFVLFVGETPIYISERIQTKAKWPGTIKIEATSSLNNTGCFWNNGFKSFFRIEGLIGKLQPDMVAIDSKDEVGNTEFIYGLVSRKRKVIFGNEGLPDYLYLKLAMALALDGLVIERVAYTLPTDEKIEPAEDFKGYPMYRYEVILDLKTNAQGNTVDGVDGEDTSGVILVVDAISVGLPGGSLVRIDLDNG